MNFIIKILVTGLVVLVGAYMLPGVWVSGFGTALVVALVLAFMNALVKPVLILLTIPVTILTLGLFLLVINAAIILFTDFLISGFEVEGFWWALVYSLLLSALMWVAEGLTGTKD